MTYQWLLKWQNTRELMQYMFVCKWSTCKYKPTSITANIL